MKRKLFAEVSEGFEALIEHRAGKTILWSVEAHLDRTKSSTIRLPAGSARVITHPTNNTESPA